ncbi:hypothetical protein EYF80_045991 [Liparis tanakae]|uniref:Uncharacterized protein n=1 Tax=Liparis tanakae TaxID=230148 RepID=A0A4Z2FSC8_9TELE|nr:hypothetical protein EYF80_045991 [Liparis tanakae]
MTLAALHSSFGHRLTPPRSSSSSSSSSSCSSCSSSSSSSSWVTASRRPPLGRRVSEVFKAAGASFPEDIDSDGSRQNVYNMLKETQEVKPINQKTGQNDKDRS